MEKKTIGSFIAALRKANGMTQKELAERLNVSDKTVSRWERDEGAPDLSVIPVLAEIFSVSCDELLRGERKAAEQRGDAGEESSKRGERQRQRLLTVSLFRYKTRTLIAAGISCAGLIAAMVGNFGFLRAYVGFFLGTAFYLAGVICQVIFLNSAFLSVSEACTEEESGTFKWSAIRMAEWSLGLTAVLFAFSLPLVLVTGDAYAGLRNSAWFQNGILLAGAALAIAVLVCFWLNGALLRKGVCALPGQEKERYWNNRGLKKRCGVTLAVVLAATLLVQAFGSEMIWSVSNLAGGTVFEDYDSFVAFMEQAVPYDGSFSDPQYSVAQEQAEQPLYGEEAVPEPYRLCTLEDANGTVVCEYYDRNESVARISYSPKDGTVLPIRVVTNGDYYWGSRRAEQINLAYCLLYPVEMLAALLYYRKKRMK